MKINVSTEDFIAYAQKERIKPFERFATIQYLKDLNFSVVEYEGAPCFKLALEKQYKNTSEEKRHKLLLLATERLSWFFAEMSKKYGDFTKSALETLSNMLTSIKEYYGHKSNFNEKHCETFIQGRPLTADQIKQFRSTDREFKLTGAPVKNVANEK